METASDEPTAWLESVSVGVVEFVKWVWAMAVAVKKVRRTVNDNWRVEAPAEWTIEDPVAGKECIGEEVRIPVPTRSVPSRTIPARASACSYISTRLIDAGLGKIAGT